MPKLKGHIVAPLILQRCRDFRHPLTPPEAQVWKAVRSRQLGFKIRRQHPIGRFIVDFRLGDTSCRSCRQIRARRPGWRSRSTATRTPPPTRGAYDCARTAWLEERGYQVIRFHIGEDGGRAGQGRILA